MSAIASTAIMTPGPGSRERCYRASAAFDQTRVTPTHLHIAIANGHGISRPIAWLFGFVLWPFLAVGLQQHTGSFAAAFLLIPAAMGCMALGVWWFTPEHAGQDLDDIAT
jgi:hypothetical protein